MNAHDLDELLDCFDPEYESTQPAHPERNFRGREQVRANWSASFAGVPDFRAQLLGVLAEGDIVCSEWSRRERGGTARRSMSAA
jgi:SnoaL-like domain